MTDRDRDITEIIRRDMLASNLPAKHAEVATDVMTTDEMSALYTVIGFMAPFVVVQRKSDGKKGSLEFTHNPRRYFNWQED